jgi:hypothetical protein
MRHRREPVIAHLTVKDQLPAGATFVALNNIFGAGVLCSTPPVGSNGTVTCNSGRIFPSPFPPDFASFSIFDAAAEAMALIYCRAPAAFCLRAARSLSLCAFLVLPSFASDRARSINSSAARLAPAVSGRARLSTD